MSRSILDLMPDNIKRIIFVIENMLVFEGFFDSLCMMSQAIQTISICSILLYVLSFCMLLEALISILYKACSMDSILNFNHIIF